MTKKKNDTNDRDAALDAFEKAMALLYDGKWKNAEKAFQEIVESQPRTTLAQRAQQFADVCANRSLAEDDGADLYLQAVHAKNLGDLDEAADICSRGGLKGRDERFAYLAGAIESLRENAEEAMQLLEKAVEMNPDNRVHAFHDPDFRHLRANDVAAELFAVD